MSILAISSPKGGVGKTTVSLNLAYAFSGLRYRTLLVDLDPQGSVGLSLSGRPKTSEGLFETLAKDEDPFRRIIPTRRSELFVLTTGQVDWANLPDWSRMVNQEGRLRRMLDVARASFDLVILDTPAGCGGLTRDALGASTHVLSPLQTEPLALRALPQLLATVAAVRAEGAPLELVGVLLTMVRFRESVAADVAQEVWGLLPDHMLMKTHIPFDRVFSEASAKGVPIGLLRRHPPPVAAVFEHLAAEMEPRLDLTSGEEDDEPIHLVD